MLQKLVTVSLEKLCEEELAAKKLNLDAMSEEEMRALMTRILDEVVEQQNKAGFRVAAVTSDLHLDDELLFLCTESPITTPQHAKLVFPWTVEELNNLEDKNRAPMATLRLQGVLAEMNAAHLRVDAIVAFTGGGLLAIVTEV